MDGVVQGGEWRAAVAANIAMYIAVASCMECPSTLDKVMCTPTGLRRVCKKNKLQLDLKVRTECLERCYKTCRRTSKMKDALTMKADPLLV